MTFLGDANGHGFVFVGIETANHGSRGCERDFVFAGAAAKEDADAKTFIRSGT